MTDKELEKVREDWRRPGLVAQHSISKIKELLDGLWSFSTIKHGNLKKGEGDVVIVNLKPLQDSVALKDYIGYFLCIDKIQTQGIYTNIFFSKKFFSEVVKLILNK